MRTVYFDNAATSFPKPPSVIRAVDDALIRLGGNPGHGGHRLAMAAADAVYEVRTLAANFFGGSPERVVFTSSCTHALNMAIKGLAPKEGHILTSMIDHNASLRPVDAICRDGRCSTDSFPVGMDEEETFSHFLGHLRPDTRLVVCSHGSNLSGVVLPVKRIGAVCRERGIPFILDAAQTAGHIPVTFADTGASVICTAGHKGLLGMMGTGLLLLDEGISFPPLMAGGTGTDSLELRMPDYSPERYEPGTLNLPGILSVGAGLKELRHHTLSSVHRHEIQLAERFYKGIDRLPKVRRVHPFDPSGSLPVISFVLEGMSGSALSERLSDAGFMLRGGYHCAALAHRLYQTEKTGTVRFSPGIFNRTEEVDALLYTLKKIARNS